MKRKITPILFVSALLILATLNVGCISTSENALQQELTYSLAWKRAAFNRMKRKLSEPVLSRVQAMPADLMSAIKSNDSSIGISSSSEYTTRSASDPELELMEAYLVLLPAAHQRVMSKKLLAIYLVNDFAGAGYTDWVLDQSGNTYYYLILNTALFSQSLDDWLTYKDNSVFDGLSNSKIQVTTGTGYKALLYALLHEGAHLVDYDIGVTPYVDDIHRQHTGRVNESSAFTRGVWVSQGDPFPIYDFEQRQQLNVYGIFPKRGKISASQTVTMFQQLKQTPFGSFYSGSSWNEHLADFLTYHHIEEKLGGKVKLDLLDGGEVIQSYSPMDSVLAGELKYSLNVFYH